MWNALFSVRGEMDRRTFVLWSAVMFVTVLVAVLGGLLLGGGVLIATGRTSAFDQELVAGLVAVPTIAFVLWSTFVLYAKRFRHAGVRPVIGIVVVAAGAWILERYVGRQACEAWNGGVFALLVVWPGRKPAAPGAAVDAHRDEAAAAA